MKYSPFCGHCIRELVSFSAERLSQFSDMQKHQQTNWKLACSLCFRFHKIHKKCLPAKLQCCLLTASDRTLYWGTILANTGLSPVILQCCYGNVNPPTTASLHPLKSSCCFFSLPDSPPCSLSLLPPWIILPPFCCRFWISAATNFWVRGTCVDSPKVVLRNCLSPPWLICPCFICKWHIPSPLCRRGV